MKNFASNFQGEQNSKWAYLLGFSVYWFASLLFSVPMAAAMYLNNLTEPTLLLPLGQSLTMLILLVLSFIGGIIGIWLVVKFIHKRNFSTIITFFPMARIKRFFLGFGAMFAFSLLYDLVNYFIQPENYQIKAITTERVIMAVAITLLIPFQAASEEILCRGYLLQGFSRITKSVVLSLLLQGLIFTSVHLLNPEFASYDFVYTILTYFSTAILLGIIAACDNGLELSTGLHAGGNVYAFAFVSYPHSAIPSNTFIEIKNFNVQEALFMGILFYVALIILFKFLFKWQVKNAFTVFNSPTEIQRDSQRGA